MPAGHEERAAHGKVNLALAVTGRREDGFHELDSILMRVALADKLGCGPAAADTDTIEVIGEPAPASGDNLVLRAASLVRAAVGHPLPPLAFHLDKCVPIGAGLGGGSSDAAAAIELCCACWGVGLSDAVRDGLARRLGADVPFFASGAPAARVTGTGEGIEPLPTVRGGIGILLVTPAVRLATREVYQAFDELPAPGDAARAAVAALADALRTGIDRAALATMAPRLRDANDLWGAAIVIAPGLTALREGIEEHLGRPALLSGSGSTLFCLYPSVAEAAEAGQALVAGPARILDGARVAAVDDRSPDPAWRHP